MLPDFFSLKGCSDPNPKPGKLKYDWVLDMIICYANVCLGWNSQDGEALGTDV